MTAACYSESITRVLKSEGGYVNHPSDPGGETNYGITIAVARANGYTGSMRALPLSEAKRIYRAKYWDAVRGDDDPAGLDYALFDYGVNSGPSRANKVLRRVCSLPDNADWPTTFNAMAKRDSKAVIGAVNAERLRFLQSLKTWPTFGKGWGARVQSVNAAALKMAALGDAPIPSALPPVPMPSKDAPQGKGEVPKPKTAGPVVTTGAGGGGTAGATWWDWVAAHPFVSVAIAVVTLIALILIADYLAARWQKAKQDAPTPGLIPVPETKG